jgi:hypothetical protein
MLTITTRDIWPNPQRKLQARCGSEVRIYAADLDGEYPVAGVFRDSFGDWSAEVWKADGSYHKCGEENPRDIIEAPPALVRYYIDVPEGQEPICFVPTGEVRMPRDGEYFVYADGVLKTQCDFKRLEETILTPVEAKRAEA